MAGRSTDRLRGFLPGLVLGLVVGAFAGAVLPPLISGQRLTDPGTRPDTTPGAVREREDRPPARPLPSDTAPPPAPAPDDRPAEPRGDETGGEPPAGPGGG